MECNRRDSRNEESNQVPNAKNQGISFFHVNAIEKDNGMKMRDGREKERDAIEMCTTVMW